MLGTYVDLKLGNRAVVQVFEGTSGVDVKKVSARSEDMDTRGHYLMRY
jgi:vacuolar-type H+-ATPase subunit B/Vma2